MKVTVGIIVALIVGIVVGGALYTGNQTQKQLDELVAMVNANPGYQASWRRYDKGLFATEAVMDVSLSIQPTQPAFTMPLVFSLNHGPLIFGDGFKQGMFSGHVRMSEDMSQELKSQIQAKGEGPIYEAQVFMSLSGRIEIHDRSLPIEAKLGDNATLTITAYEGSGVITRDDQLTYSGSFPELIYVEDGKTLVHAKHMQLSMAADFAKSVGANLMPGSMVVSMAQLQGEGPGGEQFELENFSFGTQVEFTDADTLANIVMKTGFDSFKGLGEDITNVSFSLALKRISVEFIKAYQKSMTDAMEQGGNQQLAMMQLMGPLMSDLIPQGPIIEIQNSGFQSAEGAFFMNAVAKIDGDKAKSVTNPLMMFGAVDVDARMEISKALLNKWMKRKAMSAAMAENATVEEPLDAAQIEERVDTQTEMQLNLLVIQKMLVDEGEKYTSKFTIKEGKALVNGTPAPIPF